LRVAILVSLVLFGGLNLTLLLSSPALGHADRVQISGIKSSRLV
jgi:hypothetical protein